MSLFLRALRRWIPLVSLTACFGLLSGCAWSPRHTSLTGEKGEFVRKVDWSQAPGMKGYAEEARRIGNEMYPKILALLVEDVSTVPQQFDIIFKPLRSGNTAETHLKSGSTRDEKVFVNATYFTTNATAAHWMGKDPEVFRMVLIHELVHVAQQCKAKKMPGYWVDGIADCIRFKLGHTNGSFAAECTVDSPNYKSGYACAGAFLLFVEAKHGTNVVRQLNAELRRGSYSDEFFAKTTGESLEELWTQFQGTTAYTPSAAKMNKLAKLLGYVDGKPPKDIDAKFEAYVRGLRGGTNTASALRFMKTLADKGQLPGFSKKNRPVILKGERLHGSFVMPTEANPDAYPVSRKLFCEDARGDSTYWYVVIRASAASEWEISKAWRTDSNEFLVETYR